LPAIEKEAPFLSVNFEWVAYAPGPGIPSGLDVLGLPLIETPLFLFKKSEVKVA